MFPLSKEFVLKKLELALKASRRATTKSLRDARLYLKNNPTYSYAAKNVSRAERALKGFNSIPGIPYRPRLGVFRGHMTSTSGRFSGGPKDTVSVSFDFETGEAYSFEWYRLGGVVKGKYILNSYRYSHSTSDHVRSLRKTLKLLGIKYTELEAPRGLQRLEESVDYHVTELAKETVRTKYAKKYKNNVGVRHHRDQLKVLASLGFKVSEKTIVKAIESAESDRTERNESLKERSKTQRIARKIRLIERREKAASHLTELKKSKYAYAELYFYYSRGSRRKKFEVVDTSTLEVDDSKIDNLMRLKSVPGTSKRACINFLKVTSRLGVSHVI